MSDARDPRSAGGVFSLKYHLVGCRKYRWKGLVGTVAEDLKTRLYQKAAELQVTIAAPEVMQDHVHRFVSADPSEAAQRLANQDKGYSSRWPRLKYAPLRSRLPSLWSLSDDVGSLGQVSEETVMYSIAAQKEA